MAALLLLLVAALAGSSMGESVHWQWRALDCLTHNGTGVDHISPSPANCNLKLSEEEFDEEYRETDDDVCHDEVVNGTTRSYCNLLCPKADTVYLIKRRPQTHRSCFVFYTHQLERRGDDWFLWRSKKCLHSQIEFTIRCEFKFPRKDYFSDTELFRRLRRKI